MIFKNDLSQIFLLKLRIRSFLAIYIQEFDDTKENIFPQQTYQWWLYNSIWWDVICFLS